jgi:hypothetical protein
MFMLMLSNNCYNTSFFMHIYSFYFVDKILVFIDRILTLTITLILNLRKKMLSRVIHYRTHVINRRMLRYNYVAKKKN